MYADIDVLKKGLARVGLSARHKARLSFRYRFLTGKSYQAEMKAKAKVEAKAD
jgi:hypothetical protein